MTNIEKDNRDQTILLKYSEEACIKAVHDSWNTCFLILAESPQYENARTRHLTTISSGVAIPMFNRAMFSRLSSTNVDEKIQETIAYFESRGLPFTWQVDPTDTPADLSEHLEKHGLTLSSGPGMALALSELNIPETQNELAFERVRTRELYEVYARLLAKAYGMPEFAWEDLVQIMLSVGLRDDFHHYLGYLEGQPVATAAVLYSDGVAGIYNIATLPEARGRRMGSMITAAPLIDACERGYKVSILHSTQMGYNMYKRLGYEEVCRKVGYVWNPESAQPPQ
jgi:ribosomal protein S18 acetylase RimI-like enzyme